MNTNVNITGNFLWSTDPSNAYFENITVDAYKMRRFYDSHQILGNYPEANVTTFTYFNNITVEESHGRTRLRNPGDILKIEDVGNITATNIDGRKFKSFKTELAAGFGVGVHPTCCLLYTSPQNPKTPKPHIGESMLRNII